MLGPIGMQELLVIGLVIMVLFGVNRIGPALSSLGEGIRQFKKSMRGEDKE